MLLSPDRGRGWERGQRTSIPPLLASPPSGGEEHEGERGEEGQEQRASRERNMKVGGERSTGCASGERGMDGSFGVASLSPRDAKANVSKSRKTGRIRPGSIRPA